MSATERKHVIVDDSVLGFSHKLVAPEGQDEARWDPDRWKGEFFVMNPNREDERWYQFTQAADEPGLAAVFTWVRCEARR